MGPDIEVIRLPTQLPVRMTHLFSLLKGDGDGSFRQIHSKLTVLTLASTPGGKTP